MQQPGRDSLHFGTSGLRGPAAELAGPAAFHWASAFLKALGETSAPPRLHLGRDLRPSSPEILRWVAGAARACGIVPIDHGVLPTPALALHAMSDQSPAIMVTGSHIPVDRNGLKFFTSEGEITKADEKRIIKLMESVSRQPRQADCQTPTGMQALERYRARYRDAFPPDALAGLRIGVCPGSSCARAILPAILSELGAHVLALAESSRFEPLDTEAVEPQVLERFAKTVATEGLDALVTTDPDADRPMIVDETGCQVQGDAIGALTAAYLGIRTVVTPVTSNSGLEKCGLFEHVLRTRIGSPHVIAALDSLAPDECAAGFEANGGVILAGTVPAVSLAPLMTRDAVLPILAVLATGRRARAPLSLIVGRLALQSRASDRLAEVSPDQMARFMAALPELVNELGADVFAHRAVPQLVDATDGLAYAAADGSVVRFRPSGNAPELRCYVEAADEATATGLLERGLAFASARIASVTSSSAR